VGQLQNTLAPFSLSIVRSVVPSDWFLSWTPDKRMPRSSFLFLMSMRKRAYSVFSSVPSVKRSWRSAPDPAESFPHKNKVGRVIRPPVCEYGKQGQVSDSAASGVDPVLTWLMPACLLFL
jgi:hypothetical protein